MLTFEKVLDVFADALDRDPLYEVIQTSHGYTLMGWEPMREKWSHVERMATPEDCAMRFSIILPRCARRRSPAMSEI